MATEQKTKKAPKTTSKEQVIEHSENTIQAEQTPSVEQNKSNQEDAQLKTKNQAQPNGKTAETEQAQALWQRLEKLKSQLTFSEQDLQDLKCFVKAELTYLKEELSKLGKDIKEDISQISLKHKENLTETIKRSKANAVEVWNKVQH